MSFRAYGADWTVLVPTALIFLFGGVTGVAVDRLWRASQRTELPDAPLTAHGMVEELGLDPAQEARLTALLDTLEPAIARAAVQGPDSLQAAARIARQRMEDALPPDVRGNFRRWMTDRRDEMMADRRSGDMMRWMPMMEPEMMRRWMPDENGSWDRWMDEDRSRGEEDRWRERDSNMMRDRDRRNRPDGTCPTC